MAPLSWVTAVIALPRVSCGCCIASPFWSVGGGPRRQGKEEQELKRGHQLEDQRQLLLKPQHDHEGHHGEPLPSRPPEPFDPAREAEQVRQECAAGGTRRHGGANASDGEEPGQQQAEQSRSLIHHHAPGEIRLPMTGRAQCAAGGPLRTARRKPSGTRCDGNLTSALGKGGRKSERRDSPPARQERSDAWIRLRFCVRTTRRSEFLERQALPVTSSRSSALDLAQ